MNTLRMLDIKPHGAYLEGDEIDPRILLPTKDIPEGAVPDDEIEVFLYHDSEDRIIATTRTPIVMLGEFAYLKVVGAASFGVFVDWGLAKDLLVPNNQQGGKMTVGQSYLIKVKRDADSELLFGTHKEKYFFEENHEHGYETGDKVSLLPYRRSKLGTVCLIDDRAIGLLYQDEYPGEMTLGSWVEGWIKEVRPDGKIDLQIRAIAPTVGDAVTRTSDAIMQALEENDGILPLHDRSSPEEIQAHFQVSKKKFRLAISRLYKERKITLEPDGIRKA